MSRQCTHYGRWPQHGFTSLKKLRPQSVTSRIQPGSDVIVCAEMDEQWGYVGAKSRQRWLFYAYDRIVNLCTSEHLLVHHPMLEGILLSECERLRQRSLANKLISLFRQFGGTELRLKLVWLCWLDLMTGNSLEDWKENLKRKSEKELEEWIINRQRQSAALTDLMDQYVLLAYRTTVDDSRN